MDKFLDRLASFGRKTAEKLAAWLHKQTKGKLSPNTVSLFGMLAYIPVGLLISDGKLWQAGIVLTLVAPLDMLDGALARTSGTVSAFGGVLDASLDRLKEILVYVSIIYLALLENNQWLAVLAGCAMGLSLLVSYVKAKGETALAAKDSGLSAAQLNRQFAQGLFRFEVRTILLIIGLLTAQLEYLLAVIVIGGVVTVWQRLMLLHQKL